MNHHSTLFTHLTLGLLLAINLLTVTWANESSDRPLSANVDIALVIDDTKEMATALPGLSGAVRNFMNQLPNSTTPPQIALITFNHQVNSRLVTHDPQELLKAVQGLTVSQEHSCAKATVEALTVAAQNLKEGGTLLLATQSGPRSEDDLNGLKTLLTQKNLRMTVLVSGDCQE